MFDDPGGLNYFLRQNGHWLLGSDWWQNPEAAQLELWRASNKRGMEFGEQFSETAITGSATRTFARNRRKRLRDSWTIGSFHIAQWPILLSPPVKWIGGMPWGYTTAKIISAAGEFIDAAMTAFPKQAAAMAHSGNDSTLDAPYAGDYEARSIITNARTKRGSSRPVVEKHNLCAVTPPIIPPTSTSWRVLYDSQLAVEAQMLWFSYGDTTYRNNGGTPCDPATSLRRAIDIGVSYGMKYIETYQQTHSVL